MYKLLQQHNQWHWVTHKQQPSKVHCTPLHLVHYNSSKQLTLTCAASPYGVGAVLSHKFEEKPIGFTSREFQQLRKIIPSLIKKPLRLFLGLINSMTTYTVTISQYTPISNCCCIYLIKSNLSLRWLQVVLNVGP